ncbi:DUF1064 domain-containing protein [Paenibacillus sp. 32O-W]|uniref:DUF1064 domain-containing protein n=1 Tax=Paenibacillus sp. 32O-W TaxID=1695218 RepID=UPI0009E6E5A9|nr:DUF1064 domain-containing protein [Paenibacillus sp. 32O-W]
MTIEEYRMLLAGEKKPKYRNKRTKVDGISFDSKAEANRYVELKALRSAGEVQWFILQPRFLLQEGFEKDGVTYEKMEYVADFLICWTDGSITVEDVKGMKTRTYRDKRKLFEKRYPTLKIVEVEA